MAFVEVMHRWRPAHGGHGAGTAHTEDHLLFDPVSAVARVEAIGDGAILRAVRLDVGVEREQGHPADGETPHPGGDGATRHRDLDHESGVDRAEVTRFVHLIAL